MNTPSHISVKIGWTRSRKRKVHVLLTGTAELPQGQLHEVKGPAHQHQDADVGNQEGAAPILVSRKGESPNIAKT